jgi:hypothetical protein
MNLNAPVAQLDRALPSEGKGHTFESCRVRHRSLDGNRDDPGLVSLSCFDEKRTPINRATVKSIEIVRGPFFVQFGDSNRGGS